jgi:hypothetical protein
MVPATFHADLQRAGLIPGETLPWWLTPVELRRSALNLQPVAFKSRLPPSGSCDERQMNTCSL